MDYENDLKNGANLIVRDSEDRILMVREKTRARRLILPGGAVERGEAPRHAAQSETEEETGIVTDESNMNLVGIFVQRPKGVVFLYETNHYHSEISVPASSLEVSEAMFLSFDEIVGRGEDDVRTAYLRMLLQYMRCRLGLDPTPFEGRLSDKVELPANYHVLNRAAYSDLVISF